MGMFDYVDFVAVCNCGATLGGFQTKDLEPAEMRHVVPWKVSSFYTTCSKCGAWVEYNDGIRTIKPKEK